VILLSEMTHARDAAVIAEKILLTIANLITSKSTSCTLLRVSDRYVPRRRTQAET